MTKQLTSVAETSKAKHSRPGRVCTRENGRPAAASGEEARQSVRSTLRGLLLRKARILRSPLGRRTATRHARLEVEGFGSGGRLAAASACRSTGDYEAETHDVSVVVKVDKRP